MDSAHVIESLGFELEYASEERAFERQERLAGFARGRGLRVIEEVFDEMNPPGGEVLRLDRLELDLGPVDEADLEHDLARRLREALRLALSDGLHRAREQAARLGSAGAAPSSNSPFANAAFTNAASKTALLPDTPFGLSLSKPSGPVHPPFDTLRVDGVGEAHAPSTQAPHSARPSAHTPPASPHAPFGLSLSKPPGPVHPPFDTLRANGVGEAHAPSTQAPHSARPSAPTPPASPHAPFGLSLSKPPGPVHPPSDTLKASGAARAPGPHPPQASVHPRTHAWRAALLHFLQHGHLPWHADRHLAAHPGAALHALLHEDGPALAAALRTLPPDSPAWRRLAGLAPPRERLQLARLLAPTAGDWLQHLAAAVDPADPTPGAQGWRHLAWAAVLPLLAAPGSATALPACLRDPLRAVLATVADPAQQPALAAVRAALGEPPPQDAGNREDNPVPAQRNAWRAQVEAALQAGSLAGTADTWQALLRHDRGWLRVRLAALGRSARARRTLARGLDPALLLQLIGVWVDPATQRLMAAVIHRLRQLAGEAAARGQGEMAQVTAPVLWEHTLAHLWVDGDADGSLPDDGANRATPAAASAPAGRGDGPGGALPYVESLLRRLSDAQDIGPQAWAPASEPARSMADVRMAAAQVLRLVPTSAPQDPGPQPSPAEARVRQWRELLLAALAAPEGAALALDPRSLEGLLRQDPAWLRATLQHQGRAAHVRSRIAQALGPALLRDLLGLWVPPARQDAIAAFVQGLASLAHRQPALARLSAAGLWAHALGHLWQAQDPAQPQPEADEQALARSVLRQLAAHGEIAPSGWPALLGPGADLDTALRWVLAQVGRLMPGDADADAGAGAGAGSGATAWRGAAQEPAPSAAAAGEREHGAGDGTEGRPATPTNAAPAWPPLPPQRERVGARAAVLPPAPGGESQPKGPSPQPSPVEAGEGAARADAGANAAEGAAAAQEAEEAALQPRIHAWRRLLLAGLAPATPQAPALDTRCWAGLLRHDAAWLRATLQRLGRSAAVRRRIAHGLDDGLLRDLTGLWVAPDRQHVLAATVQGLDRLARRQPALSGVAAARLWEHALAWLWLERRADLQGPQAALPPPPKGDEEPWGGPAVPHQGPQAGPSRPPPVENQQSGTATLAGEAGLHDARALVHSVLRHLERHGDVAPTAWQALLGPAADLEAAVPWVLAQVRTWAHEGPAAAQPGAPATARAADALRPAEALAAGAQVPGAQEAGSRAAPALVAHPQVQSAVPGAVPGELAGPVPGEVQHEVPDASPASGAQAPADALAPPRGNRPRPPLDAQPPPAAPPKAAATARALRAWRRMLRTMLAPQGPAAAQARWDPACWEGLLRHDAPWLRAKVQRLGRFASVRRALAHGLSPALLRELAGLWVAPDRQDFIAAFVQGLARWLSTHPAQPQGAGPGLWAHALGLLWMDPQGTLPGAAGEHAFVTGMLRRLAQHDGVDLAAWADGTAAQGTDAATAWALGQIRAALAREQLAVDRGRADEPGPLPRRAQLAAAVSAGRFDADFEALWFDASRDDALWLRALLCREHLAGAGHAGGQATTPSPTPVRPEPVEGLAPQAPGLRQAQPERVGVSDGEREEVSDGERLGVSQGDQEALSEHKWQGVSEGEQAEAKAEAEAGKSKAEDEVPRPPLPTRPAPPPPSRHAPHAAAFTPLAALRRALAQRLPQPRWLQSLSPWLTAGECDELAAAVRHLARATVQQDPLAGDLEPWLWERTLDRLWRLPPQRLDLHALAQQLAQDLRHPPLDRATPSPASAGEGRGEGSGRGNAAGGAMASHAPHPNPLPLMQAREHAGVPLSLMPTRGSAGSAPPPMPAVESAGSTAPPKPEDRSAAPSVTPAPGPEPAGAPVPPVAPSEAAHPPPPTTPENGPAEEALLRALQARTPLPPADAAQWRAQWAATTAQPSPHWRQHLRQALEAPPAATRLVELLPRADLVATLRLLRPADHADWQATATLVTQACRATGVAGATGHLEALAWQAIFREAIEEGRPLHTAAHTAGFARRLVADLARQLMPPDPPQWQRALVQALARGSDTLAAALRADLQAPTPPAPIDAAPWDRPVLDWDDLADGDAIHVGNAGLVLAGPYLPRLLRMLGLAGDVAFTPPEAATERGVHLLQAVVDGRGDAAEPLLVLNKLLCGLPLATPVPPAIELTAQELAAIDGMLKAMIQHWRTLGNTSVAGLRETFLQREGRLLRKNDAWHLVVERRPLDVLLDRLPWGFATLKYPWMEQVLHVQWS